jgi:hypothetical protein
MPRHVDSSEEDAAQLFDEFRVVKVFRDRVARFAARHRGLTIGWFTFAFPPWVQPDWFVTHAMDLANAVASKDGEGIWLLADVDESGVFHWHGIALSSRERDWFETFWRGAIGASRREGGVRYLNEYAAPRSLDFQFRLIRALILSSGRLPSRLRHRAITSGPMNRLWRKAIGARAHSVYLDNWITNHGARHVGDAHGE